MEKAKEIFKVIERNVVGDLELHAPLRIRSLHGIKESKKHPEIMCTVEWRFDPALQYAPLDSMVTYAQMRKERPDLVCLYYEDHLKVIEPLPC